MWLFLVSDALTFGALLCAYGAVRIGSADWPVPSSVLDVPLTAFNTFVLICSSVTMVKGLSAIRHGNVKALQKFLLLTALGGIIFLSIQAYEYHHLLFVDNLRLRNSLFCATFFSLTSFHGAHVFAGVIYLFDDVVALGPRGISPRSITTAWKWRGFIGILSILFGSSSSRSSISCNGELYGTIAR